MANGDDRRTTLSTDLQDYIDRGQLNLIVSGNSEVYVGDKQVYTGGQYEPIPQYEERYKAAQEGFKAIIQDENLYGQMSQAYNLFNNKPINSTVAPDDLERFYSDATLEASRRDPSEKVSALDVIFGRLPSQNVLDQIQGPVGGPRGGAYTGPRTRTSVSITSPEDAEVLLQEAARDMIGRSLTAEEIEKYTKQYRKRERKAVSTTTTTPTSTVTEQGTSKETILRSLMENNPDFARYQIDTGFMDMFVDSIREGQAVINAGR